MAKATSKHKFTSKDTDAIVALGYTLEGIAHKSFSAFMQKHYAGFDLAMLLKHVEDIMMAYAVSTVTRRIKVEGDAFNVCFENKFKNEDDALVFERTFSKEQGAIKVSHDYLIFPIPARNQGLSKNLLKVSLEQYKNMGAVAITVVAGLSSGAYVWAKYGFVAVHKVEMEKILKRAKKILAGGQYRIVEAIFNDYYDKKKGVDAFPIQRWALLPFMQHLLMQPKSQWEGRLDLKNKQQLRKFENYVSK